MIKRRYTVVTDLAMLATQWLLNVADSTVLVFNKENDVVAFVGHCLFNFLFFIFELIFEVEAYSRRYGAVAFDQRWLR